MTIEQRHRINLGITMVLVALSVGAIFAYFTYQAAFEEEKTDLINIVKTRARFIESVAQFDLEHSAVFPAGHVEATLSQIRNAHEQFESIGETGEFVLVKLEGNQIVFLIRQQHPAAAASTAASIPVNSIYAEPMRRALQGESGFYVGLDYRGEKVLAAFEPVSVLNFGLVAKMDLAELKVPLIRAGFWAAGGGFVAILLGLIAFVRLSEPLLNSIKELQGKYERAVKGSRDGLWDWPDINEDEEWWSDEWYGLLGLDVNEVKASYSNFKKLLHPDDLPRVEEALKNHLYGQDSFDIEYRLKHKSGEYKWFRGRGLVKKGGSGKRISMSGSISDIHEAKKNEEMIEMLSQVVQQIPVSVLITDQYGNIEYANEALKKLSGYTTEEILGQTPRVFKSGESPDDYYGMLWKTISKGKEWRGVFHNKKKSGELYWESVLIFPLKDINGKVSNFIGLKEDITEKKKLESTLIDHERLIRSVVNNINDGLIIANIEGNIQLFNHGAEEIFGYKAEEVMNKSVSVLMDDSNKKNHDAGFGMFQKTQKISHKNKLMEVEGRRKDGSPVPVELTLTKMEQRGEVLVVGLIRDISERKEADKKRRDSELQLNLVLEGAEVYYWDWHINTDVVVHDPRWRKELGYSKEEFQNTLKQCKDLIHPEDIAKFAEAIDNHFNGKTELFEVDYRVLKKSGEWMWVLDRGRILEWDEDGKPLRAYGTFLNIQKRKEVENEIRIAQKQLIRSEKLAGVGELAAGVSHEVLNPVNIISVHTQMLKRKCQNDPGIQQFCSKVKHEIDRITKIMGSLLAFSREGEAQFKKGNLKDEIEKVLVLVEEEFKLVNIEFVRSWCDESVEIEYDADKMRQVYLNLVNNAKYAMPQGGTITVGCLPTGNENYHKFTLSDTGAGMSEEVRLKVFDPFFTTKPEGEGTGMGLAIIHGIIAEHEGKIRVESEEGKGTTFIISLPLA